MLFAEKDFNLPKHPEIDVPNLEVIKLMQVGTVEGHRSTCVSRGAGGKASAWEQQAAEAAVAVAPGTAAASSSFSATGLCITHTHPWVLPPHPPSLPPVQSFKSKEYVTERYAWRHFYW